MASYFSLDPRKAAIADLTRRIVLESFGVLLFQLATLGVVMYVLVIRRVKRLSRAAAAVAGGDLTVRLPEGNAPASADELTSVAREFDEMVRAIETRTRELQVAAETRAVSQVVSAVEHQAEATGESMAMRGYTGEYIPSFNVKLRPLVALLLGTLFSFCLAVNLWT